MYDNNVAKNIAHQYNQIPLIDFKSVNKDTAALKFCSGEIRPLAC